MLKLPPPPSSEMTADQLTACVRAAHKITTESNSSFVTAAHWRLGKALLLAEEKMGNDKYRAWRDSLGLEGWECSRARGIAGCKKIKTQDDAAKMTMTVALKLAGEGASKRAARDTFDFPRIISRCEQTATEIQENIAQALLKCKENDSNYKAMRESLITLRAVANGIEKILNRAPVKRMLAEKAKKRAA